jgi:hypothetical protein
MLKELNEICYFDTNPRKERSPVNTHNQVNGAKSQTHRFEKRGEKPDKE